jgi:hypothetical protein
MSLLNTKAAMVAAAVAVGAAALYLIGRKTAAAAADTAAGIVTGENALTEGTPYEGAGILGTVGAGFNAASGGYLQAIGEQLGGWTFEAEQAVRESWRRATGR